jgi:hypothetical protein
MAVIQSHRLPDIENPLINIAASPSNPAASDTASILIKNKFVIDCLDLADLVIVD